MMNVSEWHEDLQKKVDARIYIQPFSANIEGSRCYGARNITPIVTEPGQLVAVSARDIDMPRILGPVRPVLR